MKIAGSILGLKPKTKDELKKFIKYIDILHIDVMDGVFVKDTSYPFDEVYPLVNNLNIIKDVHLMVDDIDKYIYEFKNIKPTYITFHYEACKDINKTIEKLKNNNIKVGISICPDTDVSVLMPYLNDIDLILIMSVNPGMGGQVFIKDTLPKIKKIVDIKEKNNYKFLISVDGGINKDNIKLLKDVDIAVVGSYITSTNNYEEQLKKLRNELL